MNLINSSIKNKILHISARADIGGGPKHIWDIVNFSHSYVHYIACPNEEPYWSKFNNSTSCILFELPSRTFTMRAFKKLLDFVKSNEINLIHCHGRGASVYAKLLKIFIRVNVIYTLHGYNLYYKFSLKSFALTIFDKVTNFLVDKFIFVSDSERSLFQINNDVSNFKLLTINNGVVSTSLEFSDSSKKQLRNKLSVDVSKFIVFTSARFVDQKNIIEVLNIALLMKDYSDISFVIAGDGPYREFYMEFIANNNLQNVKLIGFRNDIPDLLMASDIYLTTSLFEGMPLGVLEAMAHGKPIVASNVTGNMDCVINGYNGYLYELGDIFSAAHFIQLFAYNNPLRQTHGNNSFIHQTKNFSMDNMITKIEIAYQSFL